MEEFLKYSPLHSLQPPYNMFRREIEKEILPFCMRNNIGIIAYSPLNNGILTGKFFFGEKIPGDWVRRDNPDLSRKNFQINKEIILELNEIALKYKKSLSQLALNWVITKPGITSAIVGARNVSQIEENSGCMGWKISEEDLVKIEEILKKREEKIMLNPKSISKKIKHLIFYYLSKILK
jgi:aryl-alcohol dehydrogenase-like predicted oxidoreductase